MNIKRSQEGLRTIIIKLLVARKFRDEGYAQVFFERKRNDVVAYGSVEGLPNSVGAEIQMYPTHSPENGIRVLESGCDVAVIVAADETVRRRADALIQRQVPMEYLDRIIVVTLEQFLEQPLSETLTKEGNE